MMSDSKSSMLPLCKPVARAGHEHMLALAAVSTRHAWARIFAMSSPVSRKMLPVAGVCDSFCLQRAAVRTADIQHMARVQPCAGGVRSILDEVHDALVLDAVARQRPCVGHGRCQVLLDHPRHDACAVQHELGGRFAIVQPRQRLHKREKTVEMPRPPM